MLKKSFKPAKCKTALNLAKSRIKLMKNKKDSQLRQMRREVSQLLQNRQDQTARIRVEHVVREEKMLAAYEMIEIYCELIVARLPIIESQKNCPLDLKEAITSLIFAEPRCGDIPELQDIRKHFTAKYGKDFSTAAIELHPACGVSRILVEKLSVKAPDGPEKVKILKGIAEEYSIQWEPNWFKDEDLVSSGDNLIPHTDNRNTIQTEPLNVQTVENLEEKHPHSTENPGISSQRHVRENSNEIRQSSAPRSDFSASGNVSEGMLFSPSSRTAENLFLANRQYWNMEFKDATAAAQAAAECAEQASMAARAAAQLSIRDSSRGPGRSSGHGQREGDRHFAESMLEHKHEYKTPVNRSFNQRSPRMQGHQGYTHQQGDMTERRDDRRTNKEFSESEVQYEFRQQERSESESVSHRANADRLSKSRESASTPSTAKDDYDWSNSSNFQEYEDEPAENPFHGETTRPLNQPDKFQSHSSGFGNEYGTFSNLNNWSDNIDSDISFGDYSRGTSEQENWRARDYAERDVYKGSDEKKHGFESVSGVFVAMDQGIHGYIDDNVGRNVASAAFDESGSDADDDYISTPRNSLIQKESHHFEPDLSESFRKSSIYTKLMEPLPVTFDDYDNLSPRSAEEVQMEDSDSEIGGDNHRKPATAVISPSHSRSDIEERSYSGSIRENPYETRASDPTEYFESDESSPEEDTPKPLITKNQVAGVSRRSKGSPRSVNSRPSSNLSVTTKSGHVSSNSYSTKDFLNRQTETTSSSSRIVDPSSYNNDAMFEGKSGTKLSMNKNSFSPADVEKPETPTRARIPRASVSSEKAPSRENSGKNLSHVHPKLPDFETFAAHLQSLRANRQ
ncbi:hypothetical protein RND81_08G021500 [Saponaria officinalis]|uniref:Uncharacterized protein n=1 Tax=Saponaria officinalis TaxID=3572 RepID=A0AAW1J2B7_SAPOF